MLQAREHPGYTMLAHVNAAKVHQENALNVMHLDMQQLNARKLDAQTHTRVDARAAARTVLG